MAPVFETLHEAIAEHARERPDKPAFAAGADGRPALDFATLARTIDIWLETLAAWGLPAGSRIVALLPDGPEAAVAFVCSIAGHVWMPIDPRLSPAELEQAFELLAPDLLLVAPDYEPVSASTIPTVILRPDANGPTGTFSLVGERPPISAAAAPERRSDDVALVLRTSGTTGRPRGVPLTHANLCASARHIGASFRLTPDDLRLNIMPLVHVQGLVGGVVASLYAGASILCLPAFEPKQFLELLVATRATWYSAVPTMQRALLRQLRERPELASKTRLRFIRNGSFPLTDDARAQLERAFGVPVLESYGMSETASQISCQPWPPQPRKSGSAGLVAGPQLRIVDDHGHELPAGQVGEIIVRGPNVITSYELAGIGQPSDQHFFADWLRTGDLGRLDEHGYLYVLGRAKEMINRGGEKVVPRELEEVIRAHPDVAEAVVFGVDDPRLGEEVAATVVLREGAALDPRALRRWLDQRLAHVRMPRFIELADELPRGITGKVLRARLRERLSARLSARAPLEPRPPQPGLETTLVEIWQRVLQVDSLGVHDDFFELGGHSLLVAELVSVAAERLGRAVPLTALMPDPTVAGMAAALLADPGDVFPTVVRLRVVGERTPLVCIHPAGGSIMGFANVARHLAPGRAIYGFQAPGLEGDPPDELTVDELAASYLDHLLELVPSGPVHLIGHSLGGMIAYQLAQRLLERERELGALILIDTMCPAYAVRRKHESFLFAFMQALARAALTDVVEPEQDAQMWATLFELMGGHREQPQIGNDRDGQRAFFIQRMVTFGFLPPGQTVEDRTIRRFLRSLKAGFFAARAWRPESIRHRLCFIRAGQPIGDDPSLGWRDFAETDVHALDGDHFNLFGPQHVAQLARLVDQLLGS